MYRHIDGFTMLIVKYLKQVFIVKHPTVYKFVSSLTDSSGLLSKLSKLSKSPMRLKNIRIGNNCLNPSIDQKGLSLVVGLLVVCFFTIIATIDYAKMSWIYVLSNNMLAFSLIITKTALHSIHNWLNLDNI